MLSRGRRSFCGTLGHVSLTMAPFLFGCDNSRTLTADLPLHLEDYLDAATLIGSAIPEDMRQPMEWRFDEPQPGWKATIPRPFPPGIRPAAVSQTDDALRITLGPANANPNDYAVGGVYVDVPDWDLRDWAHVVIRARSFGPGNLRLGFNLWDREGHPNEGWPYPYVYGGRQSAPLVGDSTVQTYQLPFESADPVEDPLRQLGLWFGTEDSLTVEILSITIVPLDADFADEPSGIRPAQRDNRIRRSLFVHTPAQVEYRVRIPEAGRLDTGFGTFRYFVVRPPHHLPGHGEQGWPASGDVA